MGLAITVGILGDLLENDPEAAEIMQEEFFYVNEVLAAHKLPLHKEPEKQLALDSMALIESYPNVFIHHLRRVAAHAWNKPKYVAEYFPQVEEPKDDEFLKKEIAKHSSHLISHSDCEGFYVPVEFKEVIADDRVLGGILCSTQVLMRELISIAPCLGIKLEDGKLSDKEADRINGHAESEDPLSIEYCVWISLYESARLSLKHKAAIHFG